MKIGVIFGNPETTTGGNALKFYSTIRLDIRRIETIKHGTEALGNRVKVKVAKNKIAPPFKIAEFEIMFDRGISREGEIIEIGTNLGMLQKSGTWYSYGDERIGQGREVAKKFLIDNPSIRNEIEKNIREKYFSVEKDVITEKETQKTAVSK
jgi:recombination protein RecA